MAPEERGVRQEGFTAFFDKVVGTYLKTALSIVASVQMLVDADVETYRRGLLRLGDRIGYSSIDRC